MTWNHRVVRYKDGSLGIHEAFYDEGEEVPHSITKEGVTVHGEDFTDLVKGYELMGLAFAKDILNYEDF